MSGGGASDWRINRTYARRESKELCGVASLVETQENETVTGVETGAVWGRKSRKPGELVGQHTWRRCASTEVSRQTTIAESYEAWEIRLLPIDPSTYMTGPGNKTRLLSVDAETQEADVRMNVRPATCNT